MTPAIFLDRDGTMIVDKGYLAAPHDIELTSNALDGMQALSALDLPLVCISNQSGVGRGYFTSSAVDAVNWRLHEMFAARNIVLSGWYYCPHAPDAACQCRKPLPGLALQAQRELGLDLAKSFVIGDKPSDMELALAIGAEGITVGDIVESASSRQVPDLVAAAQVISASLVARKQDHPF